jgi:hypothetical protein
MKNGLAAAVIQRLSCSMHPADHRTLQLGATEEFEKNTVEATLKPSIFLLSTHLHSPTILHFILLVHIHVILLYSSGWWLTYPSEK